MRLPADSSDFEPGCPLALGHTFIAVACRLRDQHVFVLFRFVLDHRLRRRTANFLFRYVEEGDGKFRRLALAHEVLIRVIGHMGAGLHVVDTRALDMVALAFPRQRVVDDPHRVHGV